MGYTHFDKVSGKNGLAVGARGSEVTCYDASGYPYHVGTKMIASPARKVVVLPLGAVSSTTTFCAFIAPAAGSLNACSLVTQNAISASDTNYWTVSLIDKGSDGTQSNTIASKTTKATGGTAFAAYDAWDIGTLSTTHKVLAAGDVVVLTLAASGSPTAFAEAAVMLEFIYS